MPEPYEHFLARTGLTASACTFCMRLGLTTPAAYIVLRPWEGVRAGELQTYCDEVHHFKRGKIVTTHQWTKDHPSGERLYVAVRDDGKWMRLVANEAALRGRRGRQQREQPRRLGPGGRRVQQGPPWGRRRPRSVSRNANGPGQFPAGSAHLANEHEIPR